MSVLAQPATATTCPCCRRDLEQRRAGLWCARCRQFVYQHVTLTGQLVTAMWSPVQ